MGCWLRMLFILGPAGTCTKCGSVIGLGIHCERPAYLVGADCARSSAEALHELQAAPNGGPKRAHEIRPHGLPGGGHGQNASEQRSVFMGSVGQHANRLTVQMHGYIPYRALHVSIFKALLQSVPT
jgi:hypothetical protein